nr:hypothetical protein [uncultured Methanospirillum sp.]
MATKPAPKTTARKPVKPVAKPKPVQANENTSEISDLKKIIDMQAKQLLQLNKTVGALQTEMKEVKGKISPVAAAAAKAPVKAAPAKAAVKPKTPVKKASVAAKASVPKAAAKAPVKAAPTKAAAKPKTPAAAQKAGPVKRGRKLVQPAPETMVPVPVSVSERLNALTAKKKITQTKFAEEVDVPPNLIFDIAAQKVKTITFERIQKITTALKKYETK